MIALTLSPAGHGPIDRPAGSSSPGRSSRIRRPLSILQGAVEAAALVLAQVPQTEAAGLLLFRVAPVAATLCLRADDDPSPMVGGGCTLL